MSTTYLFISTIIYLFLSIVWASDRFVTVFFKMVWVAMFIASLLFFLQQIGIVSLGNIKLI